MKRMICGGMLMLLFFWTLFLPLRAEEPKDKRDIPEELSQLYAGSAVLLDGDSGRILFEKNGYEVRAMASTTKIMTCILALENMDLSSEVKVSAYAASQPKVHLGMREGETYRLEDLLYSLMLESHNDTAVAIAEAVSGSVDDFAEKMNEKAREISCENTCFLTPNGLDAEKEVDGKRRVHATTAEDLAKIMRYCTMVSPKREEFKTITGTKSYHFSAGGRSFSCQNHNAFLTMMDGAFSGKTGFTADAGYCYVGALERDGKTLIVALLGCGWPNHKNYKWSDTKKLMEYGLSNYAYREIYEETILPDVPVENGIPENGDLSEPASVGLLEVKNENSRWKLLMRNGETIQVERILPKQLPAPVKKGQKVGEVLYKLDGETVASCEIQAEKTVDAIDVPWCISKMIENFLLNF